MRVRVTFRYRTDTGEVEVFQVDDLQQGPPLADHDARHDAVTRDVARVVAPNPVVSEVLPGPSPAAPTTEKAGPAQESGLPRDRRLRD